MVGRLPTIFFARQVTKVKYCFPTNTIFTVSNSMLHISSRLVSIKTIGLLICYLLFKSMSSAAQSYPGPQPLLSPSINASVMHPVATQVGDSTVKYGFDDGSIGIKFPLFVGKDWMSAGGNKPLFAVLFNAQASVKQTNGDLFYKNKQLLCANAGATAMLAVGLRNLYFVSVQPLLMEDIESIKPTRIRYSGNALWRHRSHDQFNYTLGFSYSYVYGRARFLPVLGFGYHFTREDVVNVTLPFNIYYTHQFSKQLSLSLFIKPNGGSYYTEQQLNDSVKITDVLFGQTNFQLGTSLIYKSYSNLILIPEIGFAGKTHLSFDDYKTTTQPSVYVKLGIRYRFGKRATAAPILSFDPGDFGIERNDYLEE